MTTTSTIETIPVTEIRDGDIIFVAGCRCRASDCQIYRVDGKTLQYVKATSEPNATHTARLKDGSIGLYGSAKATYGREVR
jgi:hypothetical protein